jgi:DNA-binding transcriptional ArsR family regulator
MDDEPWHVRRLRELEAAVPKQRRKVEPFVKVPLWWAKQMAAATHTKRALVGIVLLHTAWKTKWTTFPLPNGQLAKLDVSPDTKNRALRDLERAGLITVARPSRKTPIVTLVVL